MKYGVSQMLFQLLLKLLSALVTLNLNMVVDKFPHSLCVKWKEYRRGKERGVLDTSAPPEEETWIEARVID